MKKGKILTLTAFIAGSLIGGVEAANTDSVTYTLNPVVVTAQRVEKTDLDTPASTDIVTAKRLKDTGRTSVFDALSHVTGFNSMSWGGALQDFGLSTSRATIRGFDKGTLVLVDGAPMNLLNYNTMSGIPVESVDHVEVVKGASSVMYGSEAMAGVVNIITKKPDGQTGASIGGTYGNYLSDYHMGVNSDTVSFYYQKQYIGDVELTSRKGMYRTSGGKVTPIGPYGLLGGQTDSFFLSAQLSDKLNFNWNYYRQMPDRISYTSYAQNRDSATSYHYDDIRNNLNLIYNDKDSGFKSVLAFNKRRSNADKYYHSTGISAISERYNMYSWTSDTQKQWNFRDGKDSLISGFTFSRENYRGMNSSKTAYNSAHRNNYSFYSSYAYQMTPDFTVTLGVREQHSEDYAKDQNVFLPQFQTLYKLNDHTSWFVNVGKSFQMPAINQYFSKAGNDFNRLKPQQGWTYETGLKWIDDSSVFKLSVYHMRIKDSFKWKKNPDDSDYLANAGDFRNTGVEVDYAHKISDVWSYHVGASISNPEDNESGKWVQDNARLQYTAGVTYDTEKWTANLDYIYLGDRQLSYYRNSAGDTFNLSPSSDLSANIQYRPRKGHALTLTMDNILGKTNSINEYENLGLPYNWRLSYDISF